MVTKKTGTAVILWEEEMKAAAVKQAANEKIFDGFKRVNIQGGIMMVDGEAVEGNSLDVVVLGSVHLNEYYDAPYNPGHPTVPVCYAYGDETAEDPELDMAPSDDVEDKQGDDDGKCAGCWANKMGSADTGRGKACKNIRRLVLVTEDAVESAEALTEAEERSLGVPVMSVKNWAKYMKNVLAEDLGRPCYGVITTVSVVPDAKSQFVIEFAFKELVNFDAKLWAAMKAKVAAVSKSIVAPYPRQAVLDALAPPVPVRRGGKPAAKGKTAPAKQPARPVAGKKPATPAHPTGGAKKQPKY